MDGGGHDTEMLAMGWVGLGYGLKSKANGCRAGHLMHTRVTHRLMTLDRVMADRGSIVEQETQ